MNTVLYLSASGATYETDAYTPADITRLVRGHGLHSLSSSDLQFDFWFSPVLTGCQRRVNHVATELLLATTGFTPKDVPMLRGAVVVATHDGDGDLDGLSWQQLDALVARHRAVSKRDRKALRRRIARDARRHPVMDPAITPQAGRPHAPA
ncbi:hypothetical protein [Mycolicibacterium goodii]|uniref:Uncharacterized protein n=1 Tax=Mycolicibacterium goodii TaxID=134601 RepID=A0A0K0X1Z8_MYCGD|nr:hypothetical protein AFA91_05695 [Mycolicibacterium goodii]